MRSAMRPSWKGLASNCSTCPEVFFAVEPLELGELDEEGPDLARRLLREQERLMESL